MLQGTAYRPWHLHTHFCLPRRLWGPCVLDGGICHNISSACGGPRAPSSNLALGTEKLCDFEQASLLFFSFLT